MSFTLRNSGSIGHGHANHGSSCVGLQRRLLEVAVVVGVDEVTGLHQRPLQNSVVNLDENLLFQFHYKAHLLDIISGAQDAMDGSNLFQTSKPRTTKTLLRPPSGSKTMNAGLFHSRSVRKLRKRANKEEIVPVSTDFLSNLPYVCLPYDSRATREASKPQTHYAVLTDVSGTRHYALILRLSQAYYATRNTSGENGNASWSLSYSKVPNSSDNETIKCYVPLCICLVTKVPYFDVLKDAISCISKEWLKVPSYELFRKELEKFVTNLSVIPCPPPGIRINFSLSGCPFSMFPPDDVNQQNHVIDIDLSLPLYVFVQNYPTLLQVIACILLEQRVVFVSENYSLLVMVMQALLSYIAPFHWPHQYVPLLFSDRIDFVACPGIFLMGCHAMHKEKIKEVENDQILVDLDTGEALGCASYEWSTSGKDEQASVEPLDKLDCYLPLRTAENVVNRLSELPLFAADHLKYPNLMSFTELQKEKITKKHELNRKIKNIFMDMMVDLFGNTLHYLDHEVGQFRTNEFLETVTGYDLPFYVKVVRTYMFKKFVKERERRTVDTFGKVAAARHRRIGADKIMARRYLTLSHCSPEEKPRSPNSPHLLKKDYNKKPKSPLPHRHGGKLTFGKVRSAGESLLPLPHRPLDARSKTVMFNRRRSVEKKNDYRSASTRMDTERSENHMPSPVPSRFNLESRDTPPPTRHSCGETDLSPLNGKSTSEELVNGSTTVRTSEVTGKDDNFLVLTLPPFPESGTKYNTANFYQRCIKCITALMKELPHSTSSHLKDQAPQHTHQASCLLLRGFYYIAAGYFLEGLADLHETAKEDYLIFPRSAIKEIVGSLTAEERKVVKKQTFYKGDEFYDTFEGIPRSDTLFYSDDDLPYKPLDMATFSNIVELSSVTSDSEVIGNLFSALSSVQLLDSNPDDEPTVDPETFSAFYFTWKQCRSDCEIALRSIFHSENTTNGLLRDNEAILKVSGVVSSSEGTGRLILTSEQLLFVTELHEDPIMTMRLTKIEDLKVIKQKNFFRSYNALSINKKFGDSFRVALKSESEVWRMIINEMRIGRMLSKDLKDHSMTLEAAAQNVGVVEALYVVAIDDELMSVNSALSWGKRLCNFTQQFTIGKIKTLPDETNQMLLLTIDLSPKEMKKNTVGSILYAPASEDDNSPRVWVALSSSKIRIVDTTSWKLDNRPIKDCTSELNSLCMNGRELWVGASDKTINVIDGESLRRSRVLQEHTAPVISVFKCGEQIVSASSNGEIIFWDKDQKKRCTSFCVAEPHNILLSACALDENTLCCCCSTCISLFSLDGDRQQMLTLVEFLMPHEIDSEITCLLSVESNEIWAGDSAGFVYMWTRKETDVSPSPPLGDRHNRFIPKSSGHFSNNNSKVAVTCLMVTYDKKVWVGDAAGNITILNSDTLCQEKTLQAHDAAVTSLIRVENRCVISGSKSKDGKISLWRYEQL